MNPNSESNDAVVFDDVESVRIEERPVPEPEGEELLIRTKRTQVSTGTELTVLSGEFPDSSEWADYASYPLTPGYNNIGEVVAAGPEANADLVGERVATWREHARYVTATEDSCRIVPDSVSDTEAAFFSIAEIVMNGVRKSGFDWGAPVAVFGLGVLGQLATRIAHFAGARPVVGFDPVEFRRELVPDRPGLVTADPTATDPAEVASAHTDEGGFPVVFEVTGNPDAVHDEFSVLREQGTLVVLSSPRGETSIDLHDHCNAPSYVIRGTHVMSSPSHPTPENPWTRPRHGSLFFDLVADGDISVESLATDVQSYREAPETYQSLLEDRTGTLGVQFDWTADS